MSHWVWDDIVELPDASAKTTTVGELLALAKADLGEDAVLELVDGLGRDIVVAFYCAHCDTFEEVVKPRHQVSDVDSVCPKCGGIRQPLLTHTIDGSETFLDKTLFEIGIPLLHVVAARSGMHYRYYELTGDESTVLTFT